MMPRPLAILNLSHPQSQVSSSRAREAGLGGSRCLESRRLDLPRPVSPGVKGSSPTREVGGVINWSCALRCLLHGAGGSRAGAVSFLILAVRTAPHILENGSVVVTALLLVVLLGMRSFEVCGRTLLVL